MMLIFVGVESAPGFIYESRWRYTSHLYLHGVGVARKCKVYRHGIVAADGVAPMGRIVAQEYLHPLVGEIGVGLSQRSISGEWGIADILHANNGYGISPA